MPGLTCSSWTPPVCLCGVNFRPSVPGLVNVADTLPPCPPGNIAAMLRNLQVTGRPCALIVSITCLYGIPPTDVGPTDTNINPGRNSAWLSACVPALMATTSTLPVLVFGLNFRPSEPTCVNVTDVPRCLAAVTWPLDGGGTKTIVSGRFPSLIIVIAFSYATFAIGVPATLSTISPAVICGCFFACEPTLTKWTLTVSCTRRNWMPSGPGSANVTARVVFFLRRPASRAAMIPPGKNCMARGRPGAALIKPMTSS